MATLLYNRRLCAIGALLRLTRLTRSSAFRDFTGRLRDGKFKDPSTHCWQPTRKSSKKENAMQGFICLVTCLGVALGSVLSFAVPHNGTCTDPMQPTYKCFSEGPASFSFMMESGDVTELDVLHTTMQSVTVNGSETGVFSWAKGSLTYRSISGSFNAEARVFAMGAVIVGGDGVWANVKGGVLSVVAQFQPASTGVAFQKWVSVAAA